MTTFPVAAPASPGFRSADVRLRRVVAVSESPFSLAQQAYQHTGARWEAELSLPPLTWAQAAVWRAWLQSLRGRFGAFTMTAPDIAVPRGTQTAPFALAASAALRATSLSVVMGANETLLAGDRISIAWRLYEVIADAVAGGSGAATLIIEPPLRAAASSGAKVWSTRPGGTWRLSDNGFSVAREANGAFTLAFSCVEALR